MTPPISLSVRRRNQMARDQRRTPAGGPAVTWCIAGVVLLGLALAEAAPAQPRLPEIILPDLLAVELPTSGLTEISPTASPLKELLASARAGDLRVTNDVTRSLQVGSAAVTWTAADGAGRTVSRKAQVYVFPFGQTPVGVSRSRRATASNNAPKIVRDAEGKVHMVWLDTGRSGTAPRVLYRRASTDATTGAVTWETEALAVSDPGTASTGAYAAIRASARAIHIAWQAPGETSRYRRFVRTNAGWTPESIRDTRATGVLWDKGPGLDVRGDDEIHVVSPTGRYAVSRDGGASWSQDAVPAPPNGSIKGPALALDTQGNSHLVYIVTLRGPAEWSSSKPNSGYWELRYVRRSSEGGWVDAHNVLSGQPGWADPHNEWDILADWPDVEVDVAGNVHAVWHGTVNTHIFGRDEAFYALRRAAGPGKWAAWEAPQALVPRPQGSQTHFSFAPSLSLDASGDLALAVTFADLAPDLGRVLDSMVRLIRAGRVEGGPLPLAGSASAAMIQGRPEQALSAWFPSASPRLYGPVPGRSWLDVLQTIVTPPAHNASYYVVYQRVDVTNLRALRPRR